MESKRKAKASGKSLLYGYGVAPRGPKKCRRGIVLSTCGPWKVTKSIQVRYV